MIHFVRYKKQIIESLTRGLSPYKFHGKGTPSLLNECEKHLLKLINSMIFS